MTARPIRHKAQVPDRNGKIFYTSITSLSHISKISGCYLSGTINGSSVRVVDVTIKGNASQGINDLISLNEVSDYITEKGYTSKDFEESLMGRFREDIIRSWGASDLLFSGINADGWYLDDDKNRGISLTYDGDGYVCEVVIWSGEKETGVDR